MCDALWKQHKFDCISLMPADLYGPGDNYHPLNIMLSLHLLIKYMQPN